MTDFTIQLADGRTLKATADDLAITDSGALLLIRTNSALTPVLALNARQWVAAYPQDAPVVWSKPAEPAPPAPRHPPLAV
ncbi:MAG: hypothetical protein K2X97_01855 [Mycobacteriaceae bacterium]|nr:hypothetical protein [Mycobacteriaceae bacterium]